MKPVVTGTIIPLGDGLTGKSVLAKTLMMEDPTPEMIKALLSGKHKSLNIEMEFMKGEKTIDGVDYDISVQFYVFPGQRKISQDAAPTFDEILAIFEFLPALKNLSVLLLVHDTTRLESLKSLESWLQVSLSKGWFTNETKVILISNKLDLQDIEESFLKEVQDGILHMIKGQVEGYPDDAVSYVKTSCLDHRGIRELRSQIIDWIASHGKRLGL